MLAEISLIRCWLHPNRLLQKTYPVIGKLNKDSENAPQEIRALKQTGLDLIKSCQIRNVINPLLADHVVRDADHFLYMIHVLEERLNTKKMSELS